MALGCVPVQAYTPSLEKQVILAKMSRRFGGRETIGLEDLEVKYVFGYCLLPDCTGSAAKTWLSSLQTSEEFQYPVPLLPPGPVTLVACAADVFKGVVTVVKECETVTVMVEHLEQSDKEGAVSTGCLLCSGNAEAASPRDALYCLLASVSTCVHDPGEDSDAALQLLLKAGTLLDSRVLDWGLLSSVLKAVESAVSLEPRSMPLLQEAVVLLRLGAYRIQEAAAGVSGITEELSISLLQAVTRASNWYLEGEGRNPNARDDVDDETPPTDSTGCRFAASVADIKDKVAKTIIEIIPIGTETMTISSPDYRLVLSSLDVNSEDGWTYTLRGTENDEKRRKGLRRALRSVAAQAAAEINIPAGLMDACQAYPPGVCPLPLWMATSYTRDATFLLKGLGHTTFRSSVAKFAGIDAQGLVVTMVSGMLGFQLPSLRGSQTGTDSLLNTSVALHFPMDTQVKQRPSSSSLCLISCCPAAMATDAFQME